MWKDHEVKQKGYLAITMNSWGSSQKINKKVKEQQQLIQIEY